MGQQSFEDVQDWQSLKLVQTHMGLTVRERFERFKLLVSEKLSLTVVVLCTMVVFKHWPMVPGRAVSSSRVLLAC